MLIAGGSSTCDDTRDSRSSGFVAEGWQSITDIAASCGERLGEPKFAKSGLGVGLQLSQVFM
jgi:hypothetical protein